MRDNPRYFKCYFYEALNNLQLAYNKIPTFVFARYKNDENLYRESVVKKQDSRLTESNYEDAVYWLEILNEMIPKLNNRLSNDEWVDVKKVRNILNLFDIWIETGVGAFDLSDIVQRIVIDLNIYQNKRASEIINRNALQDMLSKGDFKYRDPARNISNMAMVEKYLKMTEK